MARLQEDYAGFSLVELVVVVGVVALLMLLLVPSIRQMSASYDLRRAASITMSELRKAQAGATAADVDYTVEFVLGSSGGLKIYQQAALVRTIALPDWPAAVQIDTPGTTFPSCTSVGNPADKCVTFRSLGYPVNSGTALLRSTVGVTVQVIVAPGTGRVTVQ